MHSSALQFDAKVFNIFFFPSSLLLYLYQKPDCSSKYLKGHSSVYTSWIHQHMDERICCSQLEHVTTVADPSSSHNIPATGAVLPTRQREMTGGRQGLMYKMDKFTVEIQLPLSLNASHTFCCAVSLIALHVSDTSKVWGWDILAVWRRKPSTKGTRNPNRKHDGKSQREKNIARKFSVRRQCQGQSRVRCHQVCCTPWAEPQSTKARDPLKWQTPSCVCHGKRRWEEAALLPSCYHSWPLLTNYHTWQPSVLKDHFGYWEQSLGRQWMTEHRSSSQVYVCIPVCTLLNLGSTPRVVFPELAVTRWSWEVQILN